MGAAVDGAGAKLAALGAVAAVGAGIALVGVGVKAVKMAADFQQGITRLSTGAGDVTDNMAKMGQSILAVSTQTGTLTSGTDGLNAAMYLIISSGQRGAQSLDTLKAAAEGAKIEMANVTDVSQILTTIQTNFGVSTHTAAQYMDGLISAVSHGKITLEDLSTSMSPILPMAHELGIHFSDVAAAMSDMTNQGVPADRAAQALRFTMQSMIQPTAASRKAMIEWGLDTAKVAETMKTSLPDALQMYVDAAKHAGAEGTQPFIDALGAMVGGGTRAGQALWALSQSMGVWKQDIKDVNKAMGDTNKDVVGWATVQGNLNLQLDRAHAIFDAMLIQLGTKLLPILTPMVGKIADIGMGFANLASHTDFSGLASTISAVATQVGNLFGVLGKGVHFTMDSKSWQDAAHNIGDASTALGTFISEAQQAISANQGAASFIKDSWNQVGQGIGDAANGVGLFATVGEFALQAINDQTVTTRTAFLLLGSVGQQSIMTVSQATDLMKMGFQTVTDSVTGATINLQKYIKTSDLSGSTTISLAQALKLVGKNADGFLTAADYATLLKDNVGNVNDAVNGTTIDVKNMVNHTGAFLDMATKKYQQWLAYLTTGGQQSFAAWSAADQKATMAFLAGEHSKQNAMGQTDTKISDIQKHVKALAQPHDIPINTSHIVTAGQTADQTRQKLLRMNGPYAPVVGTGQTVAEGNTADQTRNKLLKMNGPYAPVVGNGSTIVAGSIADQTRQKLLNMNGPYNPIVNSGSVAAAGNTADSTRNKLLALNGSSVWNAYVNTYQNTYIATIGGPGSGPGNVRAGGGLITEPVVGVGLRTGQRWSFGENGNEMVVPLGGKSGHSSGGSAGGQPIIVNVYLDGAPVAKKLMPHIVQQIRTATGVKF